MDNSYYEIFGLDKTATQEEISKKYKALQKAKHPDRFKKEDKKKEAEEFIKKLNEANSVLGDPEKRKKYDQFGKDDPSNSAAGFSSGFPPGVPIEIQNILNQMRAEGARKPQIKIQPLVINEEVSLEDIYTGKTYEKEIVRAVICKYCVGTGFTDKIRRNCPECKGSGKIVHLDPADYEERIPGLKKIEGPCNVCFGKGIDDNLPGKCMKCAGICKNDEKYKLKITLPAGTRNGDRLIIPNEGDELSTDLKQKTKRERSDVLLIFNEKDHTLFKRGLVVNGHLDPANLLIEMEISLAESLCGYVHHFKHLSGEELYICETDVIKDGAVKVLEGKGLPVKDKVGRYGDLFIKFKVDYPTEFTESVRSKLYEILTGKKMNKTMFKLPNDIDPVIMKDLEDYNEEREAQNINNSDDEEGGGMFPGFPGGPMPNEGQRMECNPQ